MAYRSLTQAIVGISKALITQDPGLKDKLDEVLMELKKINLQLISMTDEEFKGDEKCE